MFPRLEETIREQMEMRRVVGLSIALVRGGEIVWANGYGVASVETGQPFTPDTSCGIMSVTKPIAATAVLQLRDAGNFALDDPVNRYLAPASIKNEWEAEAPVTVRQLLTHTGGLPVGIGADPPGRHPLEDYVDLAAKTSWRPGSAMVYANWGYAALGLLIERCAGKTVGNYLRDEIFAPLGMTDSSYGPPSTTRAAGHFLSQVDGSVHVCPTDEWPVIPTSPAGGCWATVLDVAKFLLAHLNRGGGVLAEETVRECHQLHARQGTSESGMGLGFRVTRSNGRKLVCHGGDGGGFTVFAGLHPDDGAGVALLINTGGMQAARSVIANTALALLVNAGAPPSSGTSKLVPGLYRSTFWDISVEARNGESPALTATDGLVVGDQASESKLKPVADCTLAAEDGMFHGFEVSVLGDQIVGGVYPFTFVRTGDLPAPAEPVDEEADLAGVWSGTVRTPLGPLATSITASASAATISSPLTGERPLENFSATRGRLEGQFAMSVPRLGDFQNFVRLKAIGGRLIGKVYARGSQGETSMPAELERK